MSTAGDAERHLWLMDLFANSGMTPAEFSEAARNACDEAIHALGMTDGVCESEVDQVYDLATSKLEEALR